MMMRASVILVACLCLSGLADPIGVGDTVEGVTLTTLDGTEVNLSDFVTSEENEGKIVVLASWSFKCPSGKPYIPYHQELAAWCEEQGVVYLAISMYGEGQEKVEKYVKEHSIEHTLAIDEGCRVAETFDTRVVNTAYVINSDGTLSFAGGLGSGDNDPVRQAVLDLKEGRPVATSSTRPSG